MWLFGTARNVLRDARRAAVRRHRLADRLRATWHQPHAADPAESIAVRDAINTLDDDAELIRLVYWEQFAVSDAGRLLGIAPSTARTRLARARARPGATLGVRDTDPTPAAP